MDLLTSLLTSRHTLAVGLVLLGWALARLSELLIEWGLRPLARRTRTTLDDRVIELLRMPVGATLLLVSIAAAGSVYPLNDNISRGFRGLIFSLLVVVWAVAWQRVTSEALIRASHEARPGDLVQPRSLPIFDIGAKVILWGAAFYFLLVAWGVDISAWLASAGILGVIIGFAAKDSVANLISGVLILADRPYKIGDYLVLDTGERGVVVEIGIRSTRILTRSEVQIIIPNAQMAAARVTNESTGPRRTSRATLRLTVAYGTPLDPLEELVCREARAVQGVVITDPERLPRVRYRAFAEVGITLDILVWISDPEQRGRVLSDLIKRLEPQLRAARVEVPLPKLVIIPGEPVAAESLAAESLAAESLAAGPGPLAGAPAPGGPHRVLVIPQPRERG